MPGTHVAISRRLCRSAALPGSLPP
jgi:hypothetical protein